MNQCLKRKRRRRKREAALRDPEDEPVEDEAVVIVYDEPQVSGEASKMYYAEEILIAKRDWYDSTMMILLCYRAYM